MKRVRIGNDFIFLWSLNRGSAPENLTLARSFELTLYRRIFGRDGVAVPYSIINGNTIKVEMTPEIAESTGNYYFKVSYLLDDQSLTDKERDVKIDVAAFQITPRSFLSEDVFEITIVSNLLSTDTSVEVIGPQKANPKEIVIRKIRKGNEFVFDWKIIRNKETEDFTQATKIKLHQYCKRFGENKKEVAYNIYNGIVSIDVTTAIANQTGAYYYELSYEIADNRLRTGRRGCVVDVTAYQIVDRTSHADEVYRIEMSTSVDPTIDYEEIEENLGEDMSKKFLSKIHPDTAREVIIFLRGIVAMGTSEFVDLISSGVITGVNVNVSDTTHTDILRIVTQGILMGQLNSESFNSGFLGSGFRLNNIEGRWTLELDDIIVRKTMQVYELIVQKIRYQGGQVLHSPAGGKITAVINGGSYWRCEHDSTDSFITGAQVLCQNFRVGSEQQNPDGSTTMNNVSVKRYWRLVTSFGKGWFNLSKTDMEAGSNDPEVGDEVAVLGHRTDPSQQAAIMIVSAGMGSPYTAYYAEINSYSTEGKEVVREGDLSGIVDDKFGQLQGYGLYSNNVYLRGVFRLLNGKTIEEEILATFSEYEVDFSVLEDSIAGKVSKTDYNENKIAVTNQLSIIEQKADSIDLSVKKIKVGGKNLLRNFDLRIPEMKYWIGGAQQVTESGQPVAQLTINGIATIPTVTVQKNSTPYLPTTITLILSDGNTRETGIAWGNYDTSVIDTFTIMGAYSLPYGVVGDKPEAKVTLVVTGQQFEIIGVVQPQAVTVTQGGVSTLPESITINVSDGSTRLVPVVWSEQSTNTVGSFTISGTYELPDGVLGDTSSFPVTLNLTVTAATDAIWDGMQYINALPNISTPKMIGWEKVSGRNAIIGLCNGKLYAWGNSVNGQLGLGEIASVQIPTQIGTDNTWTDIALGNVHALALKDGELWAWGNNRYGQLGLGAIEEIGTPQRVGSHSDWTEISANNTSSYAIRAGVLYSWGNNDGGQLGLGDKNVRNAPTQVGYGNLWTKVSAGYHFGIGLIDGSQLYSWGLNNHFQLGLGHNADRLTPQHVSPDWTHISAGGFYAMALKGTDLYVWGEGRGRLVNNSTSDVATPTLLSSGWSNVQSKGGHTLGVRNNNLYGWGRNTNGQLGLGDKENRSTPNLIREGNPDIFTTENSSIIIENGILYLSGDNTGVEDIIESTEFILVGGLISGLTQNNSDENIFTASLTKDWDNLTAYIKVINNSAQPVSAVVNKQGIITETIIPQGEGMYALDVYGATAFGLSGTDYNIQIEEYALAGFGFTPNWYTI